MMRIRSSVFTVLAALALAGTATAAHAQAREQGRLLIASQVLEDLRNQRDEAIPDRLLERAYGIAVIPDLTKVAFFAGGRRGHGVLVVRDKQGRFSSPVFVTMTGGSFGWQWGVQSTDMVLVFTTPKGIEGINGGKVTLGRGCLGRRRPGRTAGLGRHGYELQGRGVLVLAQPRGVRRHCARWHGDHHRRRCGRRLLRQARAWPPATS